MAPAPSEGPVDADEEPLALVDEAVAALEPYLGERIIPTGVVINPLLDVWGAAHYIHDSAARPIEELLTVLVSRSATTPAELVAVLDEVRIAVLQARVLTDA